MHAKTWVILLGKQFRSVTQPGDERDTEFRRSGDNLASLQKCSHSVSHAITFTSLLTERFDKTSFDKGQVKMYNKMSPYWTKAK